MKTIEDYIHERLKDLLARKKELAQELKDIDIRVEELNHVIGRLASETLDISLSDSEESDTAGGTVVPDEEPEAAGAEPEELLADQEEDETETPDEGEADTSVDPEELAMLEDDEQK